MKTYNDIKLILEDHKDQISEKFKTKELGIFGSIVKNKQNLNSDMDILVEFKEGSKTFDNYMDLKIYLEDLFRGKVDLVLKNTLKPRLAEKILKEVKYV